MNNSTNNNTMLHPDATVSFLSTIPSIALFVILIISIAGNTFLIITIVSKQSATKKPFNFIDKLTVQLAVLDIVLVLVSIPEMLIWETYGSFKFGPVGCKIVHPLSTYAVTAEVMTLLLIAYERLKVTQSKTYRIHSGKRQSHMFMALVHVVSIIIVIPYVVVLNYKRQVDGPGYMCGETWLIHQRRLYTLALFLAHYGVPAPLMIAFYYVAFRRISKANKRLAIMIQSPDSQRKHKSSTSSTASDVFTYKFNMVTRFSSKTKRFFQRATKYRSSTGSSSMDDDDLFTMMRIEDSPKQRRTKNREFTKSVQGKALFKRHVQCRALTRTFSIIVAIFVTFSLPNQLLWLYIDFFKNGDDTFDSQIINISYILTYANCVLNPWIYGLRNSKYKFLAKLCKSGKRKFNLCTCI